MKIFKDKHTLKNELLNNKAISFVPTMGGLHKGHISLIEASKKFKLKTLVSIYVNPFQFNKKKDFISYPRNIRKDLNILKKLKVNYLYMPSSRDIYGFKTKNKIYIDKTSKLMCGKFRKGHFKAVLEVVNRFLEIIKPKYIFMGKKDYQQLYLIKKHILKKKIKTRLIPCKTIRENNGVVFSSRNFNLTTKDLKIASNIYKYLFRFKRKMKNNLNIFNEKKLKKEIIDLGAKKIDYIKYYNLNNLKKVKKHKNFNLFIAYYLRNIRLIDNL